MARLTAKAVENLKPAAVRREVPDSRCRGLYLVLQPSGRKAWAVRYRFAGKTRKLTLNAGLTLAEAREAATTALREVERGNDPATLRFEARAQDAAAAADRKRDTIERLAEQFIEQHAKRKTRKSSWRQAEHVLNNIALPAWRGRTVHDIQRRDIRELVESVAKDRPVMAIGRWRTCPSSSTGCASRTSSPPRLALASSRQPKNKPVIAFCPIPRSKRYGRRVAISVVSSVPPSN
jgi:Arm DNA-binding domain